MMPAKHLLQGDPIAWWDLIKSAGPWSLPIGVAAFIWKMIGGTSASVDASRERDYKRRVEAMEEERKEHVDRDAEFTRREAEWRVKELDYLARIRRLSGLNGSDDHA